MRVRLGGGSRSLSGKLRRIAVEADVNMVDTGIISWVVYGL